MNMANVKTALELCRKIIRDEYPDCYAQKIEDNGHHYLSENHKLKHCLYMIATATAWPDERIEKAMRWLGFVQGTLWALGIENIEGFKLMNRPEGA